MLKQAIISSFRHLRRRKVFTLVNVIGLSISLLVVVSILKYAAYEYGYDGYHENTDDVYRLTVSYTDVSGEFVHYAGISNEITSVIRRDIPEISQASRILPLNATMRHLIISNVNASVQFSVENVWGADSTIYDLFHFEVTAGSTEELSKVPNAIAISASNALRYFGNDNPIGKTLKMNGNIDLTVGLVFEDWPKDNHIRPEMIFQYRYLHQVEVARPNLHFLGGTYYTYLKIADNVSLASIDAKLATLVSRHKRPQDMDDSQLHLMPLKDIHLSADHMLSDIAEVKNGRSIELMLLLAALIWLLAWVNYVNLVNSDVLQRSKEVAIRRIHGAGRTTLFWQLLIDSLLVLVISTLISLTLNQFLNDNLTQIIGFGTFQSLLGHGWLLPLFISFVALGLIVSAAYPTVLISSFKNTDLLKGKMQHSTRKISVRNVLVVSQYAVTIGLLFYTLSVVNQIRYLKSLESELNLEEVMVINGPGIRDRQISFQKGIQVFKDELMKLPGIEEVTTSNYVPGMKVEYAALLSNPQIHGSEPNYVNRIFADEDFAAVYQLKLLSGKFFDIETSLPIDDRPAVINRSAAESLGFETPEGIISKAMNYWGEPIRIIGVVEDFTMESPDQVIEPLLIFPSYDSKFFSVRFQSRKRTELIPRIRSSWAKTYEGNPFDFFFADIKFDEQYGSFELAKSQLSLLSLVGVFVASMGLFALALDAARRRKKEVGIRKVLGAKVYEMIVLFVRSYLQMIILSAVLILPLMYLLVSNWLNNFPQRISIGPAMLLLPVGFIVVLAGTMVALQVLNVARMNPVDSLRQE